MSGAPTLIQWMILLICLTTLLTTTQGRLSYLEHRDRLLYIYENDACRDMFHIIPHGKQQCEQALYHFLRIETEHQTDCPGARNPECQIIDRESRCTFVCDPTLIETHAASQDGRTATVRTKTLRAVTVTLRNYLQETEEDKWQRYERLGLRLQLQEEMAQERYVRERQKYHGRRQQFMEQMQVSQLQTQPSEQREQELEQRQRQRRQEQRRKFMEDRQRHFPSRVQGQQPEQHQPQPEQHQQQSQQELQQHQWRQLPQHQEQLHQPQPPQWQQQGQQQQLQLGGNAEARLRRRRRMDIVRGKRSQHPRLQQ